MRINILILLLTAFTLFTCEDNKEQEEDFSGPSGTFTDARDGKVYKWVKIETQIWMAENLRATVYNDGTPIPNITNGDTWYQLPTPAYCWYDNLEASNMFPYGTLYNWHAVYTGKLAPVGWHVPTLEEWETLIYFLGGPDVAGGKLKEAGTEHWDSPNTGASNITGFTAVPGGRRIRDYSSMGTNAWFWTYTKVYQENANVIVLSHDSENTLVSYEIQYLGGSVRCVRD